LKLNVCIKLVQYDSLKRFGVPNWIIFIFLLWLLVILRESVINLWVVTQITEHLLHIAYIEYDFLFKFFCTLQFLSLLSTLDWAVTSSVSIEGTLLIYRAMQIQNNIEHDNIEHDKYIHEQRLFIMVQAVSVKPINHWNGRRSSIYWAYTWKYFVIESDLTRMTRLTMNDLYINSQMYHQ